MILDEVILMLNF